MGARERGRTGSGAVQLRRKKDSGSETNNQFHWALWAFRATVALVALVLAIHVERANATIAAVWAALREQPWYRSPYFETIYVTTYYAVLYWSFYALSRMRSLERFQLRSKEEISKRPLWDGGNLRGLVWQFITYIGPLAFLDTFTRKHYAGVSLEELYARPRFGWQNDRLLPENPPTLTSLAWQTIAPIFLYDTAFYFIHLAMHHSSRLYRWVHHVHHQHKHVHWGVTNRLSVFERTGLVLLANEMLKLVSAHPLSRNVFVLVYVFLLTDSHSGFDFPVWWDKLVPGGWIGGAKMHIAHHNRHDCNFAPFFSHWDRLFGTYSDA